MGREGHGIDWVGRMVGVDIGIVLGATAVHGELVIADLMMLVYVYLSVRFIDIEEMGKKGGRIRYLVMWWWMALPVNLGNVVIKSNS